MRGEMFRSSKESDEEHLRTNMGVDRDRDKETWEGDTVGDLLDHDTCRSESWIGEVLTAEVVDDDTDGQIRSSDDRLAYVEGLVVVSRLSHFTDDVEEL